MDFTWYFLGILTGGIAYLYYELSRKKSPGWLIWAGLISGAGLILFSIAWSVGAVLEGVPRAGSMGMLLFGMPGIVIATISLRVAFSGKEERS